MRVECEYCDATNETVRDRDVEDMGQIFIVTSCDDCHKENFLQGVSKLT